VEIARCEFKEGRCWEVGCLRTGQREEVEILGLVFDKLMLGRLHEKHLEGDLGIWEP